MKEAPLVRKPKLGSNTGKASRSREYTPFDRPRRSIWKTLGIWSGVLSLLSLAGLFAYFNYTTHGRSTGQTLSEFVPAVIEAKQNPELIFDRAGSDVVNILLIGRDVNWVIKKVYDPSRGIWANMQVPDEDTPARSDTMLIVSLDRRRDTIHMISLPRDARVHLPPNKYGVRRAKLNAAHAYGGPEMLIQTIHDELGITIHHYAVIRFEGFKKLIDQVGGVEVDVLGALHRDGTRGPLKYDDNWGNLHIDLQPGRQLLNGSDAHDYVRFRMDVEGDPGRIKRQQQVMRALAKKLATQPLWNIAPLVQEVRKQFETDPDLDTAEIASAADFVKEVGDPSKIQPLTLFGAYTSRGDLIINRPKNRKLLQYVFGPTFNERYFLQNSPSTRNDVIGKENNSSPGAIEVLRRAGILEREAESSPSYTEDSLKPRLAIPEVTGIKRSSNPSSRLATASTEETTSTRRKAEEERETPAGKQMAPSRTSTALSTPANVSERAAKEPASSPRSRSSLSTPSASSTFGKEFDLSQEGGQVRTHNKSTRPAAEESPIPVPEGLSTPHDGLSPIPRAE